VPAQKRDPATEHGRTLVALIRSGHANVGRHI
jgi:hypothetical protein